VVEFRRTGLRDRVGGVDEHRSVSKVQLTHYNRACAPVIARPPFFGEV
jgi:hypothetical protein